MEPQSCLSESWGMSGGLFPLKVRPGRTTSFHQVTSAGPSSGPSWHTMLMSGNTNMVLMYQKVMAVAAGWATSPAR